MSDNLHRDFLTEYHTILCHHLLALKNDDSEESDKTGALISKAISQPKSIPEEFNEDYYSLMMKVKNGNRSLDFRVPWSDAEKFVTEKMKEKTQCPLPALKFYHQKEAMSGTAKTNNVTNTKAAKMISDQSNTGKIYFITALILSISLLLNYLPYLLYCLLNTENKEESPIIHLRYF